MIFGIPAFAGAGLLAVLDLTDATAGMQRDAVIAGILTFIAAILTMVFLMRYLKRASMMVFVIYRVLMGAALLLFVA